MAGPNLRDTFDHGSRRVMEQQIVGNTDVSQDQQTNFTQKVNLDQQSPTRQAETTSEKHIAVEQQTELEREPKSQQDEYADQLVTPEGNEAILHQHQRHLRASYPSCDMSEVSYNTDQTGEQPFPGSRHSSINTEPLTLNAEQIHEAKDIAEDVMQKVDKETAFDIFTKDTLKTIIGRVSMMEYYWRHGQDLDDESTEGRSPVPESKTVAEQINTLVEKAQEVVEANEQQQSRSVNKISGNSSDSLTEQTESQEDPALEDLPKLKND